MQFVQLIEFETERYDEADRLFDEWMTRTEGRRTVLQSVVGRDRDREGVYVEVVTFPSYEEAMANSDLPETGEFADRLAKLCVRPPTFRNLDVVRREDF